MNEDLRKWFREKWVRMDTRGNIKGDCAREPGEGKPKCLPLAKASAMDKVKRAAAVVRKRREDPVADRAGKGGKPVNVATEEVSTSQLIKKSHSKRGAPGTLKAKIEGPITMEKVRSLKNRPGATTLDKKQANFYINMHSEEYLEEKNVPTNPSLWARAKSLARSKFDVYPSAYANGWAAKWYKGKGGGWKSIQEGKQMKSLKDILEGVAVSSDFKLVNTVDAQGKPTTRKVRAHRKTISPRKDDSEEKPDVLASIQKFVGRQYAEETEQIEEASEELTPSKHGSFSVKSKLTNTKDGFHKDEYVGNDTLIHKGTIHHKDNSKPTKFEVHNHVNRGLTFQTHHSDEEKHAIKQHLIKNKMASKHTDITEDVEQIDEKDIGKHNNATTGFKPLVKKLTPKYGKVVAGKIAGSIKKKVMAKEEVELDEVSTDGYHKAAVKSRMDAAVKVASSMGQDKQAKTKLDARNKGLKRLSDRTSAEMAKANSGPQKPRPPEKEPTEAERRGYGQGRYMGDSVELDGEVVVEAKKSAAVRWHEALQKVKQQREQEEARKKENEKRALTPKQTNEAKDDEEDYSKHHKLDPDSGVEADQHIHVQLKKASDSTMKPYEVTFKNGKKHSVSSPVAKTIVAAVEKLKPEHRKQVHDELHKSYDSLMAVHKAITSK